MTISNQKFQEIWLITNQWVLCGILFFLPINLFLNNLFLTIFLALFGLQTLYFFVIKKNRPPKVNVWLLVILNIPVLLLLFGMTYSPEYAQGFKELGRLFPMILISCYVLIRPAFFKMVKLKALQALILGCAVAALLCWGLTFAEILQNNEPLSRFLSKYYASHHLAEQIDVHTPYLALFVNLALGAVVYCLHNKKRLFSLWVYRVIFALLCLFLLHLMARNAIFSFIVFGTIYLVVTKKYIPLAIFGIVVASLFYYIQTTETNFLRDRFIKSVNVFENETIFSKKDNRFDRLATNFEVFKKFPIIGPGTANEDQYRKEAYFINRDSEAYNDNYNAHNQFMEYLSTYGIVGGISFLVLFITLFKVAIVQRDVLLLFLISAFFIANLSESMLERSWGIVCFLTIVMLGAGSFQLKARPISLNPETHA